MTAISVYSLNIVELAALFAVLQGLFLTVVLARIPQTNRRANLLLCLLLLALALILVEYLSVYSATGLKAPLPLGLSLPSYLVLAPLYYFYVRTLLQIPLKKSDLLHGLPILLGLACFVPFYRLPGAVKTGLLNEMLGDGLVRFPTLALFAATLLSFQMLVYFYHTYVFVQDYEARLKEEYTGHAVILVTWLKKLSFVFCFFVVLFYLAAAEYLLLPAPGDWFPALLIVGIAIFIFSLSYYAYRQPDLFALYTPGQFPKPQNVAAKDKYQKTRLAAEQLAEYKGRVLRLMEAEQPYLDGDLRLSQLADQLDMPSHHLSQVINACFDLSFFDFISQYRIAHAKSLLQQAGDDPNILELALASGFNSKATFNRVFKQETGTTPSAFLKKQKNLSIPTA